MLVLSINFGHDASLCLFEDGTLLDFLEVERESRLKHHMGISSKRLENYLLENGISWAQIDFVCLSGTQFWGNFSTSDFEINYGYAQEHKKYFEPSELWDLKHFQFGGSDGGSIYHDQIHQQELKCNPSPVRINWFLHTLRPDASNSVEIANLVNFYRDLDASKSKQLQARFFCPLVVAWNGRKVPGFFVDHHAAHANYAAYYAKENSVIATHDGGIPETPYNSGGIYINFPSQAVYPLVSHGLALGNIYDLVAGALGLDAGKLMGLASYARPNKHIAYVTSQYLESVRSGSPLTSKYVGDMIFATAQIDQQIRQAGVKKF